MAAAELLEKLLHARFESLGVSGEEFRRPVLHEPEPIVVVQPSGVEVMLENLLLDCPKNFGSFTFAQ
jgi:hypothetical protein